MQRGCAVCRTGDAQHRHPQPIAQLFGGDRLACLAFNDTDQVRDRAHDASALPPIVACPRHQVFVLKGHLQPLPTVLPRPFHHQLPARKAGDGASLHIHQFAGKQFAPTSHRQHSVGHRLFGGPRHPHRIPQSSGQRERVAHRRPLDLRPRHHPHGQLGGAAHQHAQVTGIPLQRRRVGDGAEDHPVVFFIDQDGRDRRHTRNTVRAHLQLWKRTPHRIAVQHRFSGQCAGDQRLNRIGSPNLGAENRIQRPPHVPLQRLHRPARLRPMRQLFNANGRSPHHSDFGHQRVVGKGVQIDDFYLIPLFEQAQQGQLAQIGVAPSSCAQDPRTDRYRLQIFSRDLPHWGYSRANAPTALTRMRTALPGR